VFTSHTTGDRIFYFVHYVLPFYLFILQELGSVNVLRSGTGSSKKDKMIIFRVVAPSGSRTSPSTNWSERLALIPTRCLLYCQPVGWTTRCSPTGHSDQLVGLLNARRPVVPTSWLDCSVLADQSFRPIGWTTQRSPTSCSDQLVGLLGARRPVIPTSCLSFIVSFTGGLAR
jgi:hypothetical protein